jgi:ABC-type uncharacterized transport system permease subunit
MSHPMAGNQDLPPITKSWVNSIPGVRVDWVAACAPRRGPARSHRAFRSHPTADLTSSGTWSIALAWSIPILMAGLGGMFSERAGVVNIGLEGLLVLGTWFGAWGTLVTGNVWLGMLIGALAGALGGLLMAVVTVTYGVDHIIAGTAILVMAPGIGRYLSGLIFPGYGGSITQSPTLVGSVSFNVPFLAGGRSLRLAVARLLRLDGAN